MTADVGSSGVALGAGDDDATADEVCSSGVELGAEEG